MQLTIAIVITDITKLAGTERAVVNLSNILVNLGHKVSIISTDTIDGISAYKLSESVDIVHLGLDIYHARKLNKLKQYLSLYSELKKIKQEKKLDIIIGTYSLFNAIISFIKKVKTIGCEHFNYNSASLVHRIVRKFTYRKLSAVVVLTEKDSIHYKFLKQCFVIPNSLAFEPTKKDSYNQRIVLSIGRYTKQKGFDLLINVAERLKKTFPDWKFLIVGNGEDKDKLTNLIKQKDLDEYVILKEPEKNILDLYKSASIYCMTSRWEGIGLVLMESQACSLPAVSFDCPEGPAVIITNGENGFLCPAEDTGFMAEKLSALMKNESLRKNMGEHAYEKSFRFSSETITRKWSEVIGALYEK